MSNFSDDYPYDIEHGHEMDHAVLALKDLQDLTEPLDLHGEQPVFEAQSVGRLQLHECSHPFLCNPPLDYFILPIS